MYFFLSHAHEKSPSASRRDPDIDHWVSKVYRDLSQEIERRPDRRPGWELGALRLCTDRSADLDDRVARVLSRATVFVALCSQAYHADAKAREQRRAFDERPDGKPAGQQLPVLWEHTPGYSDDDLVAALAVAPPVDEYRDLGLLPLCRTRGNETPYRQVLAFLGDWITGVVEGRMPPQDRVPAPAPQAVQALPFVVGILTPESVSRGRVQHGEDLAVPDWRPFQPRRPESLPEQVAPFLDPSRRVPVLVDVGTTRSPFSMSPGVLLIDAWQADTAAGLGRLERALRDLERWVVPVVVACRGERPARRYEAVYAQTARAVDAALGQWRRPPSETHVIRDAEESETVLRAAVAEATQRFAQRNPASPPPRRFPPRPRISEPIDPEEL